MTILCDHSTDLALPCKEGEGTHRAVGHLGGLLNGLGKADLPSQEAEWQAQFCASCGTLRPPSRCLFLRFASPLGQCQCPGQGPHLRCMSSAVSGQWAEV